MDFVLEGLYAQRKISRSTEGQFQAAEQVKQRVARQVDPLTEHDSRYREQEEVLQLGRLANRPYRNRKPPLQR